VQRPDCRLGIGAGGTSAGAAIGTGAIARFPGEAGD
jgi:hypothetical protein